MGDIFYKLLFINFLVVSKLFYSIVNPALQKIHYRAFLCVIWMAATALHGQEGLSPGLLESVQDGQSEWDLEEMGNWPLDINKVSPDQLSLLGILTQEQLLAFFSYREQYGPFVSLYELQAIPELDPEQVQDLLPYLNCAAPDLLTTGNWERLWKEGQTTLTWSSRMNYPEPEQDNWLGSPFQWQFRFRHQYPGKISVGLQLEKDAGEAAGLAGDHRIFHIQLIRPLRWIDQLILGDFKVSWGQGLLVFQGYHSQGSGSSPGRSGFSFRPHTGMDEFHYFRGLAWENTLGAGFRLYGFLAQRRLDANVALSEQEWGIRALKKDGLHRTPAEVAQQKQVIASTGGLKIQWEKSGQKIGFQSIWGRYEDYFRGYALFNSSVDHELQFNNLYIFGEWAYSSNGALAVLQGLQLGLGKPLQVSLLYRNYPGDYQTLYGNAYGQTSSVSNEKGLQWQMQWSPTKQLQLTASTDLWRHPGAIYRVRGPSEGIQGHFQITYEQRKQYRAYLLLDSGTRVAETAPLLSERLLRLRLHLEYRLLPDLEYRIRFSTGQTNPEEGHQTLRGSVLQQDLLYRPSGKKWHFSTRVAFIHTEDYDLRFYSYENGLLNQFSIVPYYGKGIKTYLNLRYRGIPRTTLEAGINHLARPPGATEGQGNTRISFQVRYQPSN